VQIELDDLSRPEIAELLKEHLASMFVYSPPESLHALPAKANSRTILSAAEDRRTDDKACERLIDSGSIASETNSRPFSIAGAFAGCGFLGTQEQVRQEPGRTTYRVPEDNSLERPDVTPVPEKVPGESR
jgi:hypothetical protein